MELISPIMKSKQHTHIISIWWSASYLLKEMSFPPFLGGEEWLPRCNTRPNKSAQGKAIAVTVGRHRPLLRWVPQLLPTPLQDGEHRATFWAAWVHPWSSCSDGPHEASGPVLTQSGTDRTIPCHRLYVMLCVLLIAFLHARESFKILIYII